MKCGQNMHIFDNFAYVWHKLKKKLKLGSLDSSFLVYKAKLIHKTQSKSKSNSMVARTRHNTTVVYNSVWSQGGRKYIGFHTMQFPPHKKNATFVDIHRIYIFVGKEGVSCETPTYLVEVPSRTFVSKKSTLLHI